MERSPCILTCVEGGHKKIWVSMNLIYWKACRNVRYFYPDTKDEESPMCTSVSIVFPCHYLTSPCKVMRPACNCYLNFGSREAHHKRLIKNNARSTCVASIIADSRYQFGREQFSLSRDSSASWKRARARERTLVRVIASSTPQDFFLTAALMGYYYHYARSSIIRSYGFHDGRRVPVAGLRAKPALPGRF